MSPSLTFRKAGPADAPRLAILNQQLIQDEGHRNPMTLAELEERMREWLNGEYAACQFLAGEAVCGYALYRHEPDWVYVRQFFVTRDRRRAGLGQTALAWLRQHAWADARRIRLDVLVGNQAGIAFWKACGFQEYCLTMESENIRL